jgi:hypothetical protein
VYCNILICNIAVTNNNIPPERITIDRPIVSAKYPIGNAQIKLANPETASILPTGLLELCPNFLMYAMYAVKKVINNILFCDVFVFVPQKKRKEIKKNGME